MVMLNLPDIRRDITLFQAIWEQVFAGKDLMCEAGITDAVCVTFKRQ